MAKSMAQKINNLLKLHKQKKADLARATGVSPQMVTLWCKELDNGGSEPKRENIVRICEFFKISTMAFMVEDDFDYASPSYDRDVSITNLDTGVGDSNNNLAGFVKSIQVSPASMLKEISVSSAFSVKFFYSMDDTMSPTINEGDLIFVDTGITTLSSDGVYVSRFGEHVYIKRLQRRPDGSILMISDNKQYEPYLIESSEIHKFIILGRVKLTLVSKKI